MFTINMPRKIQVELPGQDDSGLTVGITDRNKCVYAIGVKCATNSIGDGSGGAGSLFHNTDFLNQYDMADVASDAEKLRLFLAGVRDGSIHEHYDIKGGRFDYHAFGQKRWICKKCDFAPKCYSAPITVID